MTVTYDEYTRDLRDFCRRHDKADLKVFTSPMVNDSYHKEYCYSDGATFCEINDITTEWVEVEVKGCKTKAPITLCRTEYWSSDHSKSKYCYTNCD